MLHSSLSNHVALLARTSVASPHIRAKAIIEINDLVYMTPTNSSLHMQASLTTCEDPIANMNAFGGWGAGMGTGIDVTADFISFWISLNDLFSV